MSKTGSMWFDGDMHPGNPGNGGCGAVITIAIVNFVKIICQNCNYRCQIILYYKYP